MSTACFAQTEPRPADDQRFYKLDFVIKELEGGKVLSSRSYITTVISGGKAVVRTGDRVQVSIPNGKPDPGSMFLEVGVNLDARLITADATKLTMHISADISGFASPESSRVISSLKWESDALIPLRKATTVFSSDGAASKRQTQLELTATLVQ
jgi:hypothetical protein